MTRTLPRVSSSGFSLIEVLVALTVLVAGVGALASLAVVSTRANTAARATTLATLLAAQKIEQLRALTWGFDALGRPLSDTTTDLTVVPAAPATGVGLTTSPADALTRNTAGYCDFLDLAGRPLGGGATPPAQAAFVRRWAIDPLPSSPADTLVLQVVVFRARRAPPAGSPTLPEEARLVTLKTRKVA